MKTSILLSTLILLCATSPPASAQHGAIYKCTQPDGRTEYSNVPCGPAENLDYITGNTFSLYSRGSGSSTAPPIPDVTIRRQRYMAREAAAMKKQTAGSR